MNADTEPATIGAFADLDAAPVTPKAMLAWNPQAPLTEGAFNEYLTFLRRNFAPSRFVLVGISPDRTDAGVLGWGMAWDDEALAYLTTPRGDRSPAFYRSHSAQSIRTALAHGHDVRLAWIDPEPRADEPGNDQSP